MTTQPNCPVCNTPIKSTEARGDRYFIECPRCGPYSMSGSALGVLKGNLSRAEDGPVKLSHVLYKMSSREQWAYVSSDLLTKILDQTSLPSPQEQFENLILWMAKKEPHSGLNVDFSGPLRLEALAAVGTINDETLAFIVEHAMERGLIKGLFKRSVNLTMMGPMMLTLDGWAFYEQLKRGSSFSRRAFMAMQFNEPEMDSVYLNHFKPAVDKTGFELKKLDEGQPAGLIDDRLRVEIRQSKFLIADLTHDNRGAYWEAGFAEGLGIPVIYTCRKDKFENRVNGTHFDTNHHLTVVWEPNNLEDAVAKLKATVRATLPADAKMSD